MARLVFLCVVVTAMILQAGTLSLAGVAYTCTASETGGAWNVASTWVNCASGVPGANDTVLVSGPKAVVTIASGESVSVALLQVDDSATLSSKGSLNAVHVGLEDGKLTSTGKVTLKSRLDDPWSLNAALYVYSSDLMLSGDLEISGKLPYVDVQEADVTIGGSVNVTGDDGDNVEVNLSQSRLSVAGDFVVNGGLYNGGGGGNSNTRAVTPEEQASQKRGIFGDDADGSSVQSYLCSIEIKGDLSVTSRDHTGNTTDEFSSTAPAELLTLGSQVVVGGDVLVQSGDALVAQTGAAVFGTGFPAMSLVGAPPYALVEFPASLIVVGGSVTVKSGSVTSLRNDSNSGNSAGSATFDMIKGDIYINGSKSSLTVQGGSSGSSTVNGGMANEVHVSVGGGSRLVVTNDVVVQAGNGGNGGDGEGRGNSGGAASVTVVYGGEMLVGGEMRVVAGNGGNASNPEDGAGYSGRGGAGSVGVINSGSINVAGDLLVSSGSSGHSARAGGAYEAVVAMSTMGSGGKSPIPVNLAARMASMNARGVVAESGYTVTGASNLRVGGNLNIIGGFAGSSSYSGSSGGSCGSQWGASLLGNQLGGLLLESLWDGEVIVGGDINIRGCDGGDSADSNGGDALQTGIFASGGVSVAVYGSVLVQAGSGGSITSSSDGGKGNMAYVIAFLNSDITVSGSLTTVAGNGGDVTNSSGQPGSIDMGSGVSVVGNSRVNVQGAVTVSGGRGGNVNTDGANWNSGGTAGAVLVAVSDRSSLVAGSVRVVLGSTGNATSSESESVSAKRSNSQESQKSKSKLPLWVEKLHVATATGDEKRGKSPMPSNGVMVSSMSSLITNGDVEIVAGPTSFSTYASPAEGKSAIVSVTGFSTATIRGDINVVSESGGSTFTSSGLCTGSSAELFVGDESVLKAQGNVRLQGGDACTGPNSTTGVQGVAYFELTDRAQFHQSGLFVLRDGKGDNQTNPDSSTGIYVVRSEWTVYPCDGAGIEMTQRNSSFFQLDTFATFKDCRGAGAKQRYPEPMSDGSADGSCSPCSCQEEALSSCPDQSLAAHLHANSIVAWLLTAVQPWR